MSANSWLDFRAQASQNPARIVLADGHDARVIEGAALARQQHIAEPLLIGSPSRIQPLWKSFSPSSEARCLDPQALPRQELERFTETLAPLAKFKALSKPEIEERLKDPLVLGCAAAASGLADGFVGGATRTTSDTLRAVFSVIGLAPKAPTVFGFFFIENRTRDSGSPMVLLADCAVVPDPTSKQLANIAIGASAAYEYFTGSQAQPVFLSFSTKGSAQHALVDKIQEAVTLARTKAPSTVFEGPWQADAALDIFSAGIKGVGDSPTAGRANVLVAPDLHCGNIAYKLVQRLGGCRCVGPVLWGTAMPANDLSRGCSSLDVLDMLALTTLQTKHFAALEKLHHGR